MKIQLSDHFDTGRLLRFTLPSIAMMVFTSIYGVVDGFFVSNYAGEIPFAAVNLIMPFIMILGTVGFMFGSGGSALVSMLLGMDRKEEANEVFSLLVYTLLGVGIVLAVMGWLLTPSIARMLGATDRMLPYCITYARISMISLWSFMLQNLFQSFLITAERPKLGLAVTIMAGCTNMLGDFLLVGVFRMGVAGAATATVCSELIGGCVPLIYFLALNKSRLRLGRTRWDGRAILRTCTNGASEFMSNISSSIVNMLYNHQLMRIAGEAGIAAYGVIMYVNFIFFAVFLGYSIGVSPVVGFHYGAADKEELKNLLKRSLRLIAVMAVVMTVAAELLAPVLAGSYVGYDRDLLAITVHGFRIYSAAFLIAGFNIFGSAFFTALNNGLISALISFCRTLIFEVIAVLVLPVFLGLDGIWSAIIVAELMALALTGFFLVHFRKKYGYA